MADMQDLEVVGCVAAVVSTYGEALKALEMIQEQYLASEPAPDKAEHNGELEQLKGSLQNGSTAVQNVYDRSFKQLGKPFAVGDRIARNALKDIIFELQQSLIKKLQSTSEKDIVAVATLQSTSDRCRVSAITVLEKLHQRLVMAAKIWSVPDAPNTPTSSTFLKIGNNRRSFESFNTNSTENSVPYGNTTSVTTCRPTPQRGTTQGLLDFIKSTGFRRSKTEGGNPKSLHQSSAASSTKNLVKNLIPKLPAIDVETSNGVWLDQNVEPVDEAAKTIRQNQQLAKSRSKSMAGVETTQSFDKELWLKPWEAVPPPPSPLPSTSDTTSENSRLKQFTSSTRDIFAAPVKRPAASTYSGSSDPSEPLPGPTEYWPSPSNNYAGFCKGAYKLQQDIRGAMRLSFRPIGSYTYSEHWKCQKCLFEGVVHGSEKKKGFDTRVHQASNGLLYRWVFLAKSHAFKGRYGGRGGGDVEWYKCIFCAAQGPENALEDEVFAGKEMLMEHLQETHTETMPRAEVLERTRCIVGRKPGEEEYFELCIPPLDGVGIDGQGVKPDVLDVLVQNGQEKDTTVVGEQEMEAEMLAGQGTTAHVENGHKIAAREPIAQVVAEEGVDGQEVDVQVVDGQIEAVQMVTGQLEEVSSDEFSKMFDKGMKVSEVC